MKFIKNKIIRLQNISSNQKADPLAIIIDTNKGKRKKQIYFENPKIENTNELIQE